MGLDFALFTLKDHDKITSEIQNFMFDELDERFKFCFPRLVRAVKWEYDYIVFKTDCAIVNILIDFSL